MGDTDKLGQELLSIYDSLTDEQKAAAKECKSQEELLEFAAKERIELPEEILDAVAGGYIFLGHDADYLHSSYVEVINDKTGEVMSKRYDTTAEARQKAAELGQSTEHIYWGSLRKLRGMDNSC